MPIGNKEYCLGRAQRLVALMVGDFSGIGAILVNMQGSSLLKLAVLIVLLVLAERRISVRASGCLFMAGVMPAPTLYILLLMAAHH
jgi:hypothetical protein